jgi:hypothetical protein
MNITPWVRQLIKDDIPIDKYIEWVDLPGDSVWLESESTGILGNSVRRVGFKLAGISFILMPKWSGSDILEEFAWDELNVWNHEKTILFGHMVTNNMFRLGGMNEPGCLAFYKEFITYSIGPHLQVYGSFPIMLKGVNRGLLSERETKYYDDNGYPNQPHRALYLGG